ncbi:MULTISPECIES: hypothetical protein [Aquimarina]|uniref:Uncharacterized protein n=1 Tax=Aquimarina algiphila TaxID=2047982 RepID=A0A554VCB7_9FLAO|nr:MULTISPECIES: hypothetical protein [Aquimarina]TSE04355.1 hypothetical protein FOF46_26375 [Aquimarina algiphila]
MERLPKKFTDRIDRERGLNVIPIKQDEKKEPENKVFDRSTMVEQSCFKLGKGEFKYPHSIKIHLNGGDTTKSMDYMHLRDKHYDRDAGIILFYNNATVTIYGEDLDELYRHLDNRKVAAISVYEKSSLQTKEASKENTKVAIVTEINVKYKDKDIEQEIEEMRQNAFKNKNQSGNGHSR